MGIAYFVRGGGQSWAVIKLYPDDREEVVQDGLTLVEAEILCAMKLEDLPRSAAAIDPATPVEDIAPRRRRVRQLSLKL